MHIHILPLNYIPVVTHKNTVSCICSNYYYILVTTSPSLFSLLSPLEVVVVVKVVVRTGVDVSKGEIFAIAGLLGSKGVGTSPEISGSSTFIGTSPAWVRVESVSAGVDTAGSNKSGAAVGSCGSVVGGPSGRTVTGGIGGKLA